MSTFSLDTNVLVYAIDPSQGAKHTAAHALLEQALNSAWPIALQVLGEFYSATTRIERPSCANSQSIILLG